MNKFVLVGLFFVLAMSFVSAVNVHIETLPYKSVQVDIRAPSNEGYELYDHLEGKANHYGDYKFDLSLDADEVVFMIYVVEYGKTYASKVTDVIGLDEDVYIEALPEGFEPIESPEDAGVTQEDEVEANETEINDTEEIIVEESETEPETENSNVESLLTGLAVTGESIFSSATIYYIIGGVVVILIVVVFFVKRKKKSKDGEVVSKEVRVKKLSDVMKEKEEADSQAKSEALKEAERKLKEAQADIERLKNDDQIREAERRLKEDEERLRKLKGS